MENKIRRSPKLLFYILYLIFSVALFTACTREDDLQTIMEEYDPENAYGDYSETYWRRVHAQQRQAYIGDLYRSYGVGYGYNGTGKYSDYDEVRDRVIDLSYIQKYDAEHGSATIIDDVSPSSYHHVYSGTDAMTICEKLTKQSSVKVDAILFQAEVKSTYNKTDMTSNEFAFCTIHDGLTLASRHLEPYDLYHIAREHPEALSRGFLRYQNLASEAIKKNNLTDAMRIIQNMFQTYGTHIIYHAKLGGKLKFSTTMNRHVVDSRTTVDEQASASFLYCIGTTEGTETQDWVKNTQTDRETHIEALGGNSALALRLSGLHDSDNMALKNQVVESGSSRSSSTPMLLRTTTMWSSSKSRWHPSPTSSSTTRWLPSMPIWWANISLTSPTSCREPGTRSMPRYLSPTSESPTIPLPTRSSLTTRLSARYSMNMSRTLNTLCSIPPWVARCAARALAAVAATTACSPSRGSILRALKARQRSMSRPSYALPTMTTSITMTATSTSRQPMTAYATRLMSVSARPLSICGTTPAWPT